jgi:hypothetical protein
LKTAVRRRCDRQNRKGSKSKTGKSAIRKKPREGGIEGRAKRRENTSRVRPWREGMEDSPDETSTTQESDEKSLKRLRRRKMRAESLFRLLRGSSP